MTKTFDEMKKIYPDWTDHYWVDGPGCDNLVVSSEELDRMIDRDETVNCTITRIPDTQPGFEQYQRK